LGEPDDGTQISELLLDLYACPMESSRWQRFLDRICREMRARSAVVQLLVAEGQRSWSSWTVRDSASHDARFEHDRYMGDSVNPRLMQRRPRVFPPGKNIFRDSDFFEPGDPALKELKDRLAAIELGHFMSASVPLAGNTRLALVLHRHLSERHPFDRQEANLASNLLPHLKQSINLAQRIDDLETRARELEYALNRVRCGLVLCRPDARVVWANNSAQQLLARGAQIRLCGEILNMPTAAETAALRRTIAQVARGDVRDQATQNFCTLLGKESDSALQCMMYPVEGCNAFSPDEDLPSRCVLMILSAPLETPTLHAEHIERLFGLSPAEARIAAALCNGLTITDFATVTGVTIGTARFQLKQVLAKTRANRQAELVRQIYSSVIAQAVP
jgi:DNA-binding CsgD family transcriptional regulator